MTRTSTRKRQIFLTIHDYNELKRVFKLNEEIRKQLRTITPNDDATEFLTYIASLYDEKEFETSIQKELEQNARLKHLLQIGDISNKERKTSIIERNTAKTILHSAGERWLFRFVTISEIKKINNTPFDEIPEVIDELVKKYTRRNFVQSEKEK